MATRIYLPSTGAAPVSPAFGSSGGSAWGQTTSADRLRGVTTKIASAMASKTTANSGVVQTILNRQYVIGPLAGSTISGTFKGQLRGSESNAGMDATCAIAIRVVKPDLSDRGVCLAITAPTLSGNEYTTSLVNRNTLVSTAITSVVASTGDYLVIEIGAKQNAVSANRSVSQSFGDDSGTDLPEDQTTTAANNPWIEFSATIPLATIPAPGVGALSATGFAPVIPTVVQPGVGAVSSAGFAPTVSIAAAPANSALSYATSAYAEMASSQASLGTSAKLWRTARVQIGWLRNAPEGGAVTAVAATCIGAIGSGSWTINWTLTNAADIIAFNLKANTLGDCVPSLDLTDAAVSGLADSDYIILELSRDHTRGAGNVGRARILNDAGTVLLSASDGSDTNPILTDAAYGRLIENYHGGLASGNAEARVEDWVAWRSAAPTGAQQYEAPNPASDASILVALQYNESSGTTIPNSATTGDAENLTITGTYTWVPLSSPGTTASPGVGALTATGFAPVIAHGIGTGVGAVSASGFAPSAVVNNIVSAGVGALLAAGFASVVAVSDNQSVSPGVGAVAAVGFAPTVVATNHQTATPGVGTLDLTGIAPTIAITAHQFAAPGVGALALAGLEPAIAIGVNAFPGVGALTLAGLSPTVAISDNQAIASGVGALSLAGIAPVVAVSDHQIVLPGVGALTASGVAPSVVLGTRAYPDVGSLTLAGLSPTVVASNHQTVATGVGALTLTGIAPAVAVNLSIATGTGALSATGFSPSVLTPQTVSPGVGALTVAGFSPTTFVGDQTIVQVGAGALVATGHAPTLVVPVSASPGVGALVLTGIAPTAAASDHRIVATGLGALSVAGLAPAVNVSDAITAATGTGVLSATGFAPTVEATAGVIALPGVGVLTLAGHAPSVEIPNTIQVGLGELAIAGHAPIAFASDRTDVFPGTGALSVAAYAPSTTTGIAHSPEPDAAPFAGIVAPSTTSVTVAPSVTSVTVGASQTNVTVGASITRAIVSTVSMITVAAPDPTLASLDVGALVLTGYEPTVEATEGMTALPGVGELSPAGFAPTLINPHTVFVGAGAVSVAGYTPFPGVNLVSLEIPSGALVVAGLAPSVVTTAHQFPAPGVGALSLAGLVPTMAVSNHQRALPGAGAVTANGFAPIASVAITPHALVQELIDGQLDAGEIDYYVGPRPNLTSGSPCVISPATTGVAVAACSVVISGTKHSIGSTGNVALTGATVPALKWAIWTISTNSAGTKTCTAAAANGTGYTSYSSVWAARPSPPGTNAFLGYVLLTPNRATTFNPGTHNVDANFLYEGDRLLATHTFDTPSAPSGNLITSTSITVDTTGAAYVAVAGTPTWARVRSSVDEDRYDVDMIGTGVIPDDASWDVGQLLTATLTASVVSGAIAFTGTIAVTTP